MTNYCRCVGVQHTCGAQGITITVQAVQAPNITIQNVVAQEVQSPNVVYVGQGGPSGAQGPAGPQGVQGTSGAALSSTDQLSEGTTNKYFTVNRVAYVHTQGVASNTWTINHNLGFFPNLTIQDSAGTLYEGEITYTDSGSLTVTFSAAFSGKAYLS